MLGVVLRPGRVGTVCHRLAGAETYTVRYRQEVHPARLIAADEDRNVCVLETAPFAAAVADLGETGALRERERVFVLDDAEASPASEFAIAVRSRVAGGLHLGLTPHLGGRDGASVVDADGRLLGLAVIDETKGRRALMALPVEWLADVAQRLPSPRQPLTPVAWMTRMRALDAWRDPAGWLQGNLEWTQARPESAWAWNSLGNAYVTHNKSVAQAREAYQRALAIDPELASAWNNLGNVFGTEGEVERAIAAYRRAIHVDPDYGLAWSNLGRLLLNTGRKDEAREVLDVAVQKGVASEKARALMELGRWHHRGPEAIRAYQEAWRIDPGLLEAMIGMAIAWTEDRQWGQAIDAYETVLRRDPRHALAWYNLGVVYQQADRFDRALEAYRVASALEPGHGLAWLALGALSLNLQDTAGGIAAMSRAVENGQRSLEVLDTLALVHLQRGEHGKAAEYFRRALDLYPDAATSWIGMGRLHVAEKKLEEAERDFQQALQRDSKSALAMAELGALYAATNAHDKALDLAARVHAAHSSDHEVWFALGRLYGHLGAHRNAITAFERTVELAPRGVAGWSALGHHHGEAGQPAQAIEAYRRAVDIDPGSIDAWVGMGVRFNEVGQIADAKEALARALHLAPGHRNALINMGVSEIRSGDLARAAEIFEGLNVKTADDGPVLANLGVVYKRTGRDEDADRIHGRLLEIDPGLAGWLHKEEWPPK